MERLPKFRLLVFWLAAAGLAAWLYFNNGGYRELIGLVENTVQQASAVEGGRLQSLLVKVGDQVKAGQTLATLETGDIMAELDGLRQELARYEELVRVEARLEEMDRLARVFDLEDQVFNQAQNLAQDRADLNSQRAEAQGLEAEIDRLGRISKSGLGRSNRLGELRARCDALKELVEMGETTIGLRERRLENARDILKSFSPDPRLPQLSRTAAQAAVNAEALRLRINLLEEKLSRRLVTAPCDGVVVNIYKLPGESALAFQAIAEVAGPRARFVEAFLSESQTRTPMPGTRVKVLSPNRPHQAAGGVVTFLSPGYSPIPAALTTRTPAILARKLYIRLEPQHDLLPGERVTVKVIDGERTLDHTTTQPVSALPAVTVANEPKSLETGIKPLNVPPELEAITRFEPSGLVWLQDLDRYLVVSDDTGLSGWETDHAPWLFLMDRQGRLEKQPVLVAGLEKMNDLEAIAIARPDRLYLISSQSVNRKGRRPGARQNIFTVKRQGRTFSLENQVEFFKALESSLDRNELDASSLGLTTPAGWQNLDIEGAVFKDGCLYLGLKEPVGATGAILWKLTDPDEFMTTKRLRPGQLSLAGYLPLAGSGPWPAGISDLALDKNGRLLVLSTLSGAPDQDQVGALYEVRESVDRGFTSKLLYRFPGRKPEGIASADGERYLIVFDAGSDNPEYTEVEPDDR